MRRGMDVPLVGRTQELTALSELLTRAASSRQAVVLEGEPGIGKTRLLLEAARCAREQGFNASAASAEELEQARAYGLLLAAAANLDGPGPTELRELMMPRLMYARTS